MRWWQARAVVRCVEMGERGVARCTAVRKEAS